MTGWYSRSCCYVWRAVIRCTRPPANGKVARHTARRWRDWLAQRGEQFAFFLRSRFPDWGRVGDAAAIWRDSLAERSLLELMAWLDRDLIVP
jgi:hypothetical protein